MTTYVYESPDNGKTVYRRHLGDSINSRELVHEDPEMKAQRQWLHWIPILRAAQTDATLQNMIDQVEVYYQLKNSP